MTRFRHANHQELLGSFKEGNLDFVCIGVGAESVGSVLDPSNAADLVALADGVQEVSPAYGDGESFEDGIAHAIEHVSRSFASPQSPHEGVDFPRCHEVGEALRSLDVQAAVRAAHAVEAQPERADYVAGVRTALQRIALAASVEIEREQDFHVAHSGEPSHATSAVLLGLIERRKVRSAIYRELQELGCTPEKADDFVSNLVSRGWVAEVPENLYEDDPAWRLTELGRNEMIDLIRANS